MSRNWVRTGENAPSDGFDLLDAAIGPAFNATAAPAVTDDSAAGYWPRSIAIFGSRLFLCLDASAGAAVWFEASSVTHTHAAYALTGHNHDANYATVAHTQAISTITSLQDTLDAKATSAALTAHTGNSDNPHAVTATQVGASVAQWNASELQGVAVSAVPPTDLQVLQFDDGSSTWVPVTLDVDATELQGVAIATTAPTNNQVLTYDSGSSVWLPASPSSGMAELVDDTTPELGGNLDMGVYAIEGVSAVEIARLVGVTSAVQSQIDTKSNTGHNHAQADVVNLVTALAAKSAITHNHDASYLSQPAATTGVYLVRVAAIDCAVNVDTEVIGAPNQQAIDDTGAASGSFRLNLAAEISGYINYDASAGEVVAALEAITAGSGWAVASGTLPGAIVVTWAGDTPLAVYDSTVDVNVSVSAVTAGTNEVQSLTITPTTAESGTFTLTFGGDTTSAINYNAAATEIEAALVALASIGTGNADCTGGPLPASVAVEFVSGLGDADVEKLTATSAVHGPAGTPDFEALGLLPTADGHYHLACTGGVWSVVAAT